MLDCAKALVEAGADKDLQDPDGVNPIDDRDRERPLRCRRLPGGAGRRRESGGSLGQDRAVGRGGHAHAAALRPARSGGIRNGSSTDLLKVLLAHEADVNVQLVTFPPYRSMSDRGADSILTIGATPLLRAAKAGDLEAIRMLLEKGADPNLPNKTGVTPVLAAAGVGSRDNDTRGRYKTEAEAIESIRMLLDAGADINAAEDRGQTALHGAAFWGWNQLVQFLADHGANLDVKDKKGMTPIDSAMGRAGGNGFGGNRIDVHQDTAALLQEVDGSAAISTTAQRLDALTDQVCFIPLTAVTSSACAWRARWGSVSRFRSAQQMRNASLQATKLGEDLVLISGAGGNVVLVVQPEGLAMVDGGLPENSRDLLSLVAAQGARRKFAPFRAGSFQYALAPGPYRLERDSRQGRAPKSSPMPIRAKWLKTRVFVEAQNRTVRAPAAGSDSRRRPSTNPQR